MKRTTKKGGRVSQRRDVFEMAWAGPLAHDCPRWQRTFMFDGERIYLPAVLAGPENIVLMAAISCGEPTLRRFGHVYVPSAWLADHAPVPDKVATIAARSRRAAKVETGISSSYPWRELMAAFADFASKQWK